MFMVRLLQGGVLAGTAADCPQVLLQRFGEPRSTVLGGLRRLVVLGHQSTLDDPRLGRRRLVDRQHHGVGGAKLAAVVEVKDDAGMLLLLGGMVPVEDGGQPVEFLGLRRVEVVPLGA